jgi:nitrogen fixation protein FixH
MSTLAASAMPRRSRWIPWVFVGGFLLVVAVNAALIFFAVNSFTGLTTTEPYTKGLRFNDQIREAEVYERLGWHVAARFSPVEARRGTIEVKLTDRNGAALTGAEVSVEFSRPVEKDRDFTLTLRSHGGGRYSADAEFPLAGIWDVKYRIARGSETLKARDRLQVK